jgi:hypothetical protein
MGAGASVSSDELMGFIPTVAKIEACLPSQVRHKNKRMVVGRVVCHQQPLVSPVHHKPCVYYKLVISVGQQEIAKDKAYSDFYLVDHMGGQVFCPARSEDLQIKFFGEKQELTIQLTAVTFIWFKICVCAVEWM